MNNKKVNEEILNNLYKNAHIALQSISDLLPEIDEQMIISELKEQYDGYEKIIGEISSYLKDNEITPKDIGPLKKIMLKASVKMNAAKEDNRTHVAEMMIKGTIMGITEIRRDLGEYQNVIDPCVETLAKKLLNLEEEYEKKLKNYL